MTEQLLNNRYRLLVALGAGGFGETFLAEDTQMPSCRRCVIKQLKPITTNPQIYQLVQERFQREAAILEQLGDGNEQIPRLYAYFAIAGQFYLVQEWIDGETLTQKVRQHGTLSESFVRDILGSLLPVLDYVHSKRIVHRDIKPDNIIVRRQDGKPVLIDFGAVRETMGTVVTTEGNATSSIVIGTPGFMPSEQAAGRAVYSSDLYSLGLTAIYLLSGKKPQELETDPHSGEILWRQQVMKVSPSLAAVLDKAIQSHPRDRYPTARDMLNALQSGAAPIPPTIASHELLTAPPPPEPPRYKLNAVIIGGLIASGLIGASFIIAFASKQSVQPPLNPPSSLSPQPVASVPSTSGTTQSPVSVPSEETQTDKYLWLSDRAVTNADLTGKSAFELDIMRNSIYARYGRRFQNTQLQSYFNNQSWYRPIFPPDKFPDRLLSSLERQNASYILEYQNRSGLRWVQ